MGLALAGCGSAPEPAPAPPTTSSTLPTTISPEPASTAPPVGPRLWEVIGAVIARDGGPVEVCHAVLDSLPPQCGGGIEVRGLDPAAVPGATSQRGVTWTDQAVRLVGTWDGTALTVTRPAEPAPFGEDPDDPDRFEPPCDELLGGPGGWSADGAGVLRTYGETQPDSFAGMWVARDQRTFTLAFTGDLELHRAGIAAVYGGPVCVAPADFPLAELLGIQEELNDRFAELGLLWSSVGEVDNRVEIGVVEATEQLVTELERRYGPDRLIVSGWLRPLEE
jgi:hypothetical protein